MEPFSFFTSLHSLCKTENCQAMRRDEQGARLPWEATILCAIVLVMRENVAAKGFGDATAENSGNVLQLEKTAQRRDEVSCPVL